MKSNAVKEHGIRHYFVSLLILLLFMVLFLLYWNYQNVSIRHVSKSSGTDYFVLSSTNLLFEVGTGSFVRLSLRYPLNRRAIVNVKLDFPNLVETIGSFVIEPHKRSNIFIPVHSQRSAGHCIMTFTSESAELKDLYKLRIDIRIVRIVLLGYISIIFGWIYFFSWSCSYYPQIIQNWRRKSVIGLSFDWLLFNFTGHTCYFCFNSAVYYSSSIQQQYFLLHPHGELPVHANDSYFSTHAVCMNLLLMFQCILYERGGQYVGRWAIVVLSTIWWAMLVGLYPAFRNDMSWLQYLYFLSYIKVATTPIKYTPQVYLNYSRKSTEGWSIYSVLLDGLGGLFSLLQLIMDGFNHDDWGSVLANPGKLGLSFISVFFCCVFSLQHFLCYSDHLHDSSLVPVNRKYLKPCAL